MKRKPKPAKNQLSLFPPERPQQKSLFPAVIPPKPVVRVPEKAFSNPGFSGAEPPVVQRSVSRANRVGRKRVALRAHVVEKIGAVFALCRKNKRFRLRSAHRAALNRALKLIKEADAGKRRVSNSELQYYLSLATSILELYE